MVTFLEGGEVAALKSLQLVFLTPKSLQNSNWHYLLQLVFCCKSNIDISGFFLILLSKGFICIKLYRFDFCFKTSFEIILPKKSQTKSLRVSAIKGTIGLLVRKPLKNALSLLETILNQNLSLAGNKGSWIMLFKY